MGKISHREKILTEGLRVVHERGFGGASVRDIIQAAGVPQGSFTNHFTSKEAFGLEIIDLYMADSRRVIENTLRNDARPPLERLAAYIDSNRAHLSENGMRNGCLYANFSAEVAVIGEAIRIRIVEIFAEIEAALAYCLDAAKQAGELPQTFDSQGVAVFILTSLQGAGLIGKAQRSPESIDRLKEILFSSVLR